MTTDVDEKEALSLKPRNWNFEGSQIHDIRLEDVPLKLSVLIS